MKLLTEVVIDTPPFTLNYKENGLVMGSCFATHIGERMRQGKMNTLVNPFGVLYNPLSVSHGFGMLYSGREICKEDLYFHNGLWHSFSHHGSFSGDDPDKVTSVINYEMDAARRMLRRLDYIIITLGSAWVYEREGCVVANCHKLPESHFTRRRMTVLEVTDALESIVALTRCVKTILTVSPVRHIRDGLGENSVSKAILRVACDEMAARHTDIYYFPAFEIMNDELRDYRFYAEDMTHPSPVAVEYIWEKFSAKIIDTPSRSLIAGISGLRSAMQHRPLHPESEQYVRFRESMHRQVKKLSAEYKDVDFGEELQFFA